MSQTDTSQISQLLVSWSQRSGLEVTPEQCVQAAVRLRQCQIADLSDERVAAIIGPLVCQSEASQQDFKLWWPRAVAQPVNPQPDEPPKPGPSIEEISVWKRWGWFLLLTVMALGLLILYWLPIKGYVCESLNRPAMLACPILEEPLPLGPEAGIPIPEPLCEQDCSYETPIQVPVTVGMRQPLPSFLESDLEKIQIAQEWLIGLTLLSGVLAYGYVSWLRKKLDQSNTRQQTEKEILSRVTLKGLPALYVNRLRQKDMSDLRYHAAGKARLPKSAKSFVLQGGDG